MVQAGNLLQRCGLIAILVVSLLVMSSSMACKRQSQVHSDDEQQGDQVVAKSTQDVAVGSDANAAASDAAVVVAGSKVPASWKPGRKSSMRKAAYVVERDGQKVEITVITLDAKAASLLDSVNGWRKQLGLEPITQAEVEKVARPISMDGESGYLVQLIGTENTESPQAVFGAMANHDGEAWFIRLVGDADLAQQEADHFVKYVLSMRFDDFDEPAAKSDATAGNGHSAAKHPKVRLVCGELPGNWTEADLRGIRKAAFMVQDGKQKALITVMELLPPEGDLLANVNLWRAQIALEPTTQDALDEAVGKLVIAGVEAPYVELVGPKDAERPAAVSAAIVPFQKRVWFFTMKGDADLVQREKGHFEAFLKSVKLEAGEGASE